MNDFKEARAKTGLSQAKVSEKTGIPERTLRSWELEEKKPAEYKKQWYLKELERLISET